MGFERVSSNHRKDPEGEKEFWSNQISKEFSISNKKVQRELSGSHWEHIGLLILKKKFLLCFYCGYCPISNLRFFIVDSDSTILIQPAGSSGGAGVWG